MPPPGVSWRFSALLLVASSSVGVEACDDVAADVVATASDDVLLPSNESSLDDGVVFISTSLLTLDDVTTDVLVCGGVTLVVLVWGIFS